MTTEEKVNKVLQNFYQEHHSFDQLRRELADLVEEEKLSTFIKAKRSIVEAIDHRISKLVDSSEVMRQNNLIRSGELLDSRTDELESFKNYIKGKLYDPRS